MPLLKDRVLETSVSTGTGAFNLNGPKSGYRSFSAAFTTGDTLYYCITDGVNFEVGIGTVTTGTPWTLSRDTVITSSNSNALVNFGVGTKDVFNTAPAVKVGGATGGGTNLAFYENDTHVTDNHTIKAGKNAMSAGPMTIDLGVTVTVESGSVWTIV